MSRPKIVKFDFGKALGTSVASKSKKEDKKEPDELILVDAFWIKDGMKIRFIPYQKDNFKLIIVFKLKHNDETHDKDKAVFYLNFEIEGTRFEDAKKDPLKIEFANLKETFSKLKINQILDERERDCYYCEVECKAFGEFLLL